MTKIIRIWNTNYISFIDDEDYDLVSQYRWYLYLRPGRGPYATTGGKQPIVSMHRLVSPSPNGLVTAHKNHNGLDNRRCNLKHVSYMENGQHQRTHFNNTSGTPGVKYLTGKLNVRRWMADITVYGKRIYLGAFNTFEEAQKARLVAELKYRGRYDRDAANFDSTQGREIPPTG